MLLDLGRNDVGRVSVRGSVRVTDSFTVERYSHVMHIVSNVVGELAPDRDALDALFARSEEHTSELQSLMRISYAVFCLKKKRANECTMEIEKDNAETTSSTLATRSMTSTRE